MVVGNEEKVKVEWIRIVKLKLESSFCLELVDIVFALFVRRSLISFSRLDTVGYSCSFRNGLPKLTFESHIDGTSVSSGGLYRSKLDECVSLQSELIIIYLFTLMA